MSADAPFKLDLSVWSWMFRGRRVVVGLRLIGWRWIVVRIGCNWIVLPAVFFFALFVLICGHIIPPYFFRTSFVSHLAL
jgi:hypothetical protein